jgi:hypothetical protein
METEGTRALREKAARLHKYAAVELDQRMGVHAPFSFSARTPSEAPCGRACVSSYGKYARQWAAAVAAAQLALAGG